MHDLFAELRGYTNELVIAARKPDRIKAINAEIKRVRKRMRDHAEALLAEADRHDQAGRNVRATQARVEAQRYLDAIGDGKRETAADRTPRERA